MSTRVVAAVVLVVTIGIIVADLIRTSILASRHAQTFRLDLEEITPLPRTERIRVEHSYKARLATVSATYRGQVTPEALTAHYAKVFEARGWRHCGRSRSGDVYRLKTTTTHEIYCRGEFQAILSLPDSEGFATFSVELKWNRWTFGVWIIAVILSWIAVLCAAVLAGRLLIFPGGSRPTLRARRRLQFRTGLKPFECMSRLAKSDESGMVFKPAISAGDDTISFALEKRRSLMAKNAFAPSFRGILQSEPRVGGTTVLGYYGFHPTAVAVGSILTVFALSALGTSFVLSPRPLRPDDVVLMVAFTVVVALIVWTRRREERTISAFIMKTLEAEPTEPSEDNPG